jgi:hypothetical protein
MKKIVLAFVVAVLALGLFTGVAAAQGNQPLHPAKGMMHDYVEQALADKLGLTLKQIETQFDAGKSLAQIALDNGVTQTDLPVFMQEVHKTAIAAAVADGVITQAQADLMLQRMANHAYGLGNGAGTGTCPMGGRGGRGGGLGTGRGMMGGFRTPQSNP